MKKPAFLSHGSFAVYGLAALLGVSLAHNSKLRANPPTFNYIFPAGGQRGSTVTVRVGGMFLHESCAFHVGAKGLTASPRLARAPRIWFEGPLLPLPESQQQEDYPADMSGTIVIAPDAPLAATRVRVSTSQGAAGGPLFVVGDLPEVVEQEIEGQPIPARIRLPITANGRIFPRDDIDLWEFDAREGQAITAFVQAGSLNSPLEANLAILDTSGEILAQTMTHPVGDADASVRFVVPSSGKYHVRITDSRSLGGPHYVYRLTITASKVPDVVFPLVVPEDGLTNVVHNGAIHQAPVALNGRVASVGAIEEWRVQLDKESKYSLELQARAAGSPLCGVISVHDADGKELIRTQSDASRDPTLTFNPPADGTYRIRVRERFRDRGGESFVYRLALTKLGTISPGYRLTYAAVGRPLIIPDSLTLLRGGSLKVKVNVERVGGFSKPITLEALNLPAGVTAKPVTITEKQNVGELTLVAAGDAPIMAVPIEIVGVAGETFVKSLLSRKRLLPEESAILLSVGIPTPFKIIDQYVMTSAPRGEVYRRRYTIERGGFEGPIVVSLADRQARHLQGVTGPVVVIPSGQTEFEYPVMLPPWMEMGRTCRVCVMATGVVKDLDGIEHAVSYSSVEQNQQMIVVVGPGRLDVSLGSVSVRASDEVLIPITVNRGTDVRGEVAIEAVLPAHWKGVRVLPLIIPADESAGKLRVRFAPDAGPFNMPLTVRATAIDEKTRSIIAEATIEVVK